MGYTKIVQYGNVTEVYSYEKDFNNNRKKRISEYAKKRQKQNRMAAKAKGTYFRPRRSIQRSRTNFFRLCHANNTKALTIHFLTLTLAKNVSFKTANQYVKGFIKHTKKDYPSLSLAYICVPELTKKQRYHFHLLIYNLPPETEKQERKTRNLQRNWGKGFLDLRLATYTSKGIAGYMAKYMAKSLEDIKDGNERGYTCSRNVEKVRSHASNALSTYNEDLIPVVDITDLQKKDYEVPYLGRCFYEKITIK